MSQAPISDIPPELLCNVFDLLNLKDQQAASRTCRQWSEVLSTHRYIRNQVLHISRHMEGKRYYSDVHKHYPNLKFEYVNMVKWIRMLLLDPEVGEHLEELYLVGSESLDEVFEGARVLNLPKLRKLSLTSVSQESAKKLTIVAPNLKCIEVLRQKGQKTEENGEYLAKPFLDQVEELIVRNDFKVLQCSDQTYANLRRLTLISTKRDLFNGEVIRRFSDQLTHLNLVARSRAIEDLLGARLDSLQELSIKNIGWDDAPSSDSAKIFLPNLKKLKVNIILAPRFVVRNLESLHVHKDTRDFMDDFKGDIKAFLQSSCSTLKVLTIENFNTEQCDFLTEPICAMTQLQALSFRLSIPAYHNLEKIFTKLKHLRRAWFMRCYVQHPMIAATKSEPLLILLKKKFVGCDFSVELCPESSYFQY